MFADAFLYCLPLFGVATVLAMAQAPLRGGQVYPGQNWESRGPHQVGLDEAKLKAFSDYVGGRGCVVRHGYMVYSWGDYTRGGDVASACKPWFSHFLLKALEDDRIPSLDEKVLRYEPRLGDINAELGHKDREITWRHMANQISCYGLAERPGTAYAYNDWQMALFWDTLFLKVYGATYENVDQKVLRPLLTDILQCQDSPTMMAFGVKNRPGRVSVSPRDFCRFGLLYLRRGNWNGQQLISAEHTKMAVTSPLPNSIPRAGRKAAEMIPGQRSIGGKKIPDNQTDHGGSYSWLWWTNGVDRAGKLHWPDAPRDTYGAFGHGGPRAMIVIPSLDLVLSWNDARIRGLEMGNEALRLLVGSINTPELTAPGSAEDVPGQGPPYPRSEVIADIEWDFENLIRLATGSDNWPITWANDDHQYTAWGDGGGFGGTNSRGRVSLGVARVEGTAHDYSGVNICGGQVPLGRQILAGKSYGIVCVDGVLYMWVGPGSNTASYQEARLYHSEDHGLSWKKADWAFTKSDGLIMPTICQFGRNYGGARDEYVYHYFIRLQGEPKGLAVHKPGCVDLARVSKQRILDRSAYEFFCGLDSRARPIWTKDLSARKPVFEDPNGVGWCMSVSYNAGLKRYLLCTEHTASFKGNLGIFDAPEPWGPWTTVAYHNDWGEYGNCFFWNFSNKWLGNDGRQFVLIFTGTGPWDSWNTVKGRFVLRQDLDSKGD